MSSELENSSTPYPTDGESFIVDNPARGKTPDMTSTKIHDTRDGLDYILGRTDVSAVGAIGIGEVTPALEDEEEILRRRELVKQRGESMTIITRRSLLNRVACAGAAGIFALIAKKSWESDSYVPTQYRPRLTQIYSREQEIEADLKTSDDTNKNVAERNEYSALKDEEINVRHEIFEHGNFFQTNFERPLMILSAFGVVEGLRRALSGKREIPVEIPITDLRQIQQ
ncbi:MAG TPA: hypothetical protein VLF68_00410 [Candidatus Saccharimonadales bacterium]|nr:hypothetical protein [Candidatus Saccharimonadales bacterium]